MVVLINSPCLDAACAEVAGEGCSESVQGEDALWAYEFDVAEQFVVVGMIAEWECRVCLESLAGTGIERPAGEDGGAAIGDAAQHCGARGARRAYEYAAGDV